MLKYQSKLTNVRLRGSTEIGFTELNENECGKI